MSKSTVDQILERFDGDVEQFSNLETGQSATIDAPLSLALIAEAASRVAEQRPVKWSKKARWSRRNQS